MKRNEAARRRVLRKLHVRWWHAPAATMKRLLAQAGVPKESVDAIIDEIVDTCGVCRTWARPLPDSVASTSVAEKFNEMVETDIVFYKGYAILHFYFVPVTNSVFAASGLGSAFDLSSSDGSDSRR